MNREVQVRFWERPRVKVPRATRQKRKDPRLQFTSTLLSNRTLDEPFFSSFLAQTPITSNYRNLRCCEGTRARVRRKPHRSPCDICRLRTDGYRGQTNFLDFEIRVHGEKVFEE